MASQWLKARQTKYAAYATIYILVVIAVVVVANILAGRYDKSFDATSNKRYSLSDQTAKIVKGLKQDATITYFDQSTRFRDGKDLLDQYANLSHKVRVEYVDPDKNPQLAREAGIRSFGTAVVQVGSKKEEAKSMTEEGITGAFIRDLKSNTRTVCFVTGSGEHQADDHDREGLSGFKDLLAKDNYESETIDLLQKAQVPADCTALVVAGPTRNYEQPEVDAIGKYIGEGGRALLMLDPPLKLGRSEIANNDALKMNQTPTGKGFNTAALLSSGSSAVAPCGATGPCRLLVITYYIDNTTTPARLMRQVSGHSPVPVAENIVYMKFSYDLFNANAGTVAIGQVDGGAALGLLPNQITKINIINMAMNSTMKGAQGGYQGADLQTSVSARNLSYVNDYPN